MGLICHLRTFCPWDVLSLGKFCPFGRFVPLDVLSLGRFVLGRFVLYVHQIYNAWQSWVSGIFLSFATTITQQHNRASVACKSTKICKASVSKWSSLNKYSYNAVSHNYLVVVAAVVACAQLWFLGHAPERNYHSVAVAAYPLSSILPVVELKDYLARSL